MSARGRLGLLLVALLLAIPRIATAQDSERVTTIARGAEIAVQTIRDGCTLDLAAQSAPSPGGATQLRYRRQGGCRSIAWEREASAVAQLLDALMPRIAGKPRPGALHWGRIEQPALQARFAKAALAADLARLDDGPELHRRVVESIDAAEVFTELRRAFAVHGLSVTARGVEKLERARPTELSRWNIDRSALGQRLTQDMRIPVAAQLWFALAPLTP